MTQPMAPPVQRRPSGLERTVTVVLMIGLGCFAVLAFFSGFLFAMVSDGCGSGSTCNSDQIGYGVAIASLSQIVVFVVALVQVVKRFRRGLPAWWVPLAAVGAGAVLFVIGGVVAATATG